MAAAVTVVVMKMAAAVAAAVVVTAAVAAAARAELTMRTIRLIEVEVGGWDVMIVVLESLICVRRMLKTLRWTQLLPMARAEEVTAVILEPLVRVYRKATVVGA